MLAGHAHGELPIRVIDTWRARIVWPVMVFAASHILTMRTPIGRGILLFVRMGGGPLLRIRSSDLAAAGVERHDARVVGVTDGKPTLADGTVLDVATVVWSTGFRPDYRWVKVPGFVGDDGWPMGTRGVVTSTPGPVLPGCPVHPTGSPRCWWRVPGGMPATWSTGSRKRPPAARLRRGGWPPRRPRRARPRSTNKESGHDRSSNRRAVA